MMQHFITAGPIGMERHIFSFRTIPAVKETRGSPAKAHRVAKQLASG
jgi:hypothetical protein